VNLLPVYVPGDQYVIQKIMRDHFSDFEERYDNHYAKEYGKLRIIRIKETVEKFLECGDMMRWNPNFHCLVLEGGIDETGSCHHIPIKDTSNLTEVFRRRVIKLFVDKGMLDRGFALNLLSWKHSGFSVDNSVPIPASSRKARVNLSQYIIRPKVLSSTPCVFTEDPLRNFKWNNYLQDEV